MQSVTNALEELAASIFRTDYAMAGSSIMLVTTSLPICSMVARSVMMEIRILCHACKLASVSDTQAFDTEDELLSYFSLNRTSQRTCAVVFKDLPSDGAVHELKYKIRISNRRFSTAQLFYDFSWQEYEGKADNICTKYIM